MADPALNVLRERKEGPGAKFRKRGPLDSELGFAGNVPHFSSTQLSLSGKCRSLEVGILHFTFRFAYAFDSDSPGTVGHVRSAALLSSVRELGHNSIR